MKKALVMAGSVSAALLFGLQASAQNIVPLTGERVSIMPYILGIVGLILVAAFAWLTYLTKKNKK